MDNVWGILIAWGIAALLIVAGWQTVRLEWDESIEFLDEEENYFPFD